MRGTFNSAVAVGTPIAGRPPHRSVRAAFPHTAPTSGIHGDYAPYASQRLCHAVPVLRPVRALLARIPLGLRPWLPRLRSGLLRLVRRLHSCRVGRGGACALPPPARSNGSCSFPASRFPMWTPLWRRGRIDAGREIDQPHKSELLHQPWKGILSPHRVSPFLGDERT